MIPIMTVLRDFNIQLRHQGKTASQAQAHAPVENFNDDKSNCSSFYIPPTRQRPLPTKQIKGITIPPHPVPRPFELESKTPPSLRSSPLATQHITEQKRLVINEAKPPRTDHQTANSSQQKYRTTHELQTPKIHTPGISSIRKAESK